MLRDVLVWNSQADAYELIGVKSSISRRRAEDGAFDLPFQKYAHKAYGVLVGGTHLMRQNSDCVRSNPIDIPQLVTLTDFGRSVAAVRQDLPSLINDANRWINIKTPPT